LLSPHILTEGTISLGLIAPDALLLLELLLLDIFQHYRLDDRLGCFRMTDTPHIKASMLKVNLQNTPA